MKQFMDIFSLPEMTLLSCVNEYFLKNNIDYEPVHLYKDVKVRAWAHHRGLGSCGMTLSIPGKWPGRKLGNWSWFVLKQAGACPVTCSSDLGLNGTEVRPVLVEMVVVWSLFQWHSDCGLHH